MPAAKQESPKQQMTDRGTTHLDEFASYLGGDGASEVDFLVTLELDSDEETYLKYLINIFI